MVLPTFNNNNNNNHVYLAIQTNYILYMLETIALYRRLKKYTRYSRKHNKGRVYFTWVLQYTLVSHPRGLDLGPIGLHQQILNRGVPPQVI